MLQHSYVDNTEPRFPKSVSKRVTLKINFFMVGGWNDKKNKLFFCRNNKEKDEFFLRNWNGLMKRDPFSV